MSIFCSARDPSPYRSSHHRVTAGWPVQGIWAAGMDGSDINAAARSNSGHLLATADDLGKVNLFR
jgi:hypothetical protein